MSRPSQSVSYLRVIDDMLTGIFGKNLFLR